MARTRLRAIRILSSFLLIVVAALTAIPAASAQPRKGKPQAIVPLCLGQEITLPPLTAPATASFGPSEDQKLNLNLLLATIVVVPAGRIASFTFSVGTAKDENVVILYDSEFQQLAARGTDPAKGLEPFRYPATVESADTIVVVSPWRKFLGRWAQSYPRPDWLASSTLEIRIEDRELISGNYRDMILNVACE
jgi:hypothetical protein